MARIYRKPPISEAICEFRFKSQKTWDWTIPGLVYQQISQEFPEKQQEQQFQITVTPQQSDAQRVGNSLTKMQFKRPDNSAMVQIGPDLLGINLRAPYPGWRDFLRLIARQFSIYVSVASPTSFSRIGMRYVNRIEFQETQIETTKYFNYYPQLPKTIEQRHGPFTMRVQHPHENERDVLVVTMANIVPSDKIGFILDLDYILSQPDKVQLDDGLAWVEYAHTEIESMFEACITDELRLLFQESK